MSVFNFITQEELEALPDNPEAAFMTFAQVAQKRLGEMTRRLEDGSSENWPEIRDARHSFMNVIVAAAKNYGVEPFVSMEIPRIGDFDENTHRQFRADLDHFLTQIAIKNTQRGKQETVLLDERAKDRIRAHLYALKECIENSHLDDDKKKTLLKKLENFETELNKRRASILATAFVVLEIMAIPGGVWASAEVTTKLINNILQTVGEAKSVEDLGKILAPPATVPVLSPPRQSYSGKSVAPNSDDDIPF